MLPDLGHGIVKSAQTCHCDWMLGWTRFRDQVRQSSEKINREGREQWSTIYYEKITEDYAIYIFKRLSRDNFIKFYPDQLITYRSRLTLGKGIAIGIARESQTANRGGPERDDPDEYTYNNRSVEDGRPNGGVARYFSKAHTWPRNPAYVTFEYPNLSPMKKKPARHAGGYRGSPRLSPKLRFRAHSRVRRPLNSTRDASAERITRACATCHF